MTNFLQFAVLGFGAGAAYALLGQGIVLIYRGSAVVNFAQGALAMVAAFLQLQFQQRDGMPFGVAFILALIITMALGALIYQIIMRQLAESSAVTLALSTLGLFVLLPAIAALIWGLNPLGMNSELPTRTISLGGIQLGENEIILLGIAVALTLVLWAWSTFTRIGIALRANAESRRSASALGWSPVRLGMLTWMLGSGLAAVAGILLAPITGITTDQMPLLVIPVLAAVLIAKFRSFPATLAAALAIGICQAEIGNYWSLPGAADAIPFVVIIAYLVVRGEQRIARSASLQRLPEIGSGIVTPWTVGSGVAVGIILIATVSSSTFTAALTVTLAWAIVLLSIVVVIGYTGQLSLAQFAIAGIAALISGHLVADKHWPFWAATIASVFACVLVGLLMALPAVRTRGINLAIVTLGLAVAANEMLFNNPSLVGGYGGLQVGPQKLFGWSIDPLLHPARYALLVLAFFVLCAVAVAGVRRGTSGGRLLALRTNERAASALGVNVVAGKLFAFGLGAALAALGGILLAFTNYSITFTTTYAPLESVLAAAYGIVGGAGFIAGAPAGGTLASGGFGSWLLNTVFPNANPIWLTVVSGASLLALIVLQPDGLVKAHLDLARRLFGRVQFRRATRKTSAQLPERVGGMPSARREASSLVVDNLSVRFGGQITVLSDVSMAVEPGEVVGVIGPNGAGKTTLIDAITGFVPTSGTISLGNQRLDGMTAYRRARLGVSRSFQSLELFENSSVADNLAVACDPGDAHLYLTELVRPRRTPLSDEAREAIREFELEPVIGTRVRDLPYGQRRLVAIARAVAANPALLLLDEPAAGLSSQETAELGTAVRRLADKWGLAVLVVEHDMTFVMGICDRIVVLDLGRVVADGSPTLIREDPAVIAAYLGTDQADEESDPGRSSFSRESAASTEASSR